jgi:hypothetical protein
MRLKNGMLLSACIAASMIASARDAPAAITGIVTDNGVIALSDDAGPVLEISPVLWGPRWAWTFLSGKIANDQGAAVGQFKGVIGGTDAPFSLDLRVERVAPRQLRVTAGFAAERDSDLTLACLALTPGARFHGAAACALTTANGGQSTRPVPFGRGQVGEGVARLALKSAADAAVTVDFATPVNIVADGAARIVLAADRVAAGKRHEVAMTLTLSAELAWYPTAADVPYPPNWNEWFAWQPTAALTATNNAPADSGVGMDAWNREPAGAHGRVVSRGNQLLVGGAPTKFWGLNDTFGPGCAPARDLAEQRAILYARMGVNAVRLHKYADGPGWAGVLSREHFTEFDPAALDRMDYFIAQLKARGIYVKLSPNFGDVRLGPADAAAIPWLREFPAKGGDGRVGAGNGSIYLASELQDLMIAQTTNLLRHRNPYTGLTYAEDPAIVVIEEFNENSILFYGTHAVLKTSPTLRKRMAERFTDWLAKRYGDEAGLNKAWGPRWKDALAGEGFRGESFAERSIVPGGNPWFFDPDQLNGAMSHIRTRLLDTMVFLYEVQCDFYKRYADAMRAAGYKGEFLTSNWQAGRAFSHYFNLHSDTLGGIIDRHNYFGAKTDDTMLTHAGSGILSSGACQVEGRPFMLSEWIHVFPNEYGVEGPAIIGAYGMGLQGWDVSYMFQNDDKGGFAKELGAQFCVTAPQIMGLFPAVARQVRRGDVREATVAAERRVHLPSLAAGKLGFEDKYQATSIP